MCVCKILNEGSQTAPVAGGSPGPVAAGTLIYAGGEAPAEVNADTLQVQGCRGRSSLQDVECGERAPQPLSCVCVGVSSHPHDVLYPRMLPLARLDGSGYKTASLGQTVMCRHTLH